MLISIASVFFAFYFDINYYIDLTLLSIAIIFPLVFTIRGSFRRREKALEHLSQFRSALKTLQYFVMSNDVVAADKKLEIDEVLNKISEKTIQHLKHNGESIQDLDDYINKIYQFLIDNNDTINRGLREKMFRFMNDLHEAIDNLNAINVHRTPISLKAYCKVFIYIFPLIYAPTIINNVGPNHSEFITYMVVMLTEFILISLYNIQDHLEYPFDDKGLDDIKLETFGIKRK
jgi:predicted membrane chloride channel (bestrophin family)